jgi:predicted ribosomally synthesized peptide with SipW-like signal peptide
MKKKLLISILTLVMCFSLMTGATFALFTSESKVNVAITSGNVSVVATVDDESVVTYSMGIEQDYATWENGGNVVISSTDNTINLNNITPGDKVEFDIIVHNKSDVKVKYRTSFNATNSQDELIGGLLVTINGVTYSGFGIYSNWKPVEVGCEDEIVSIAIELPESAGSEYANKQTAFAFSVVAIQNNATTQDVTNTAFEENDNGGVTLTSLGSLESGEITIPTYYQGKPVTEIAASAAINNEGITTLNLPATIQNIGASAFENCQSLQRVRVTNGDMLVDSQAFSLTNGITVEYDESVKQIAAQAFMNCKEVVEIVVPDGIEVIGKNAFRNCSNLERVILPDSVITIGSYAFSNCTSLQELELPSNIEELDRSAFGYCTSLTELTLPESVKTVGSYCFESCTGLTELTIPNSVTSISDGAFMNCSSLKSITIGSGLTADGFKFDQAFQGCNRLEEIVVDENNPDFSSENGILYNKGKTQLLVVPAILPEVVELPSTLETINKPNYSSFQASFSRKNFKSITIPANVKTIDAEAFYYCPSLETVIFEDGSLLTEIGKNAFSSCPNLKTVILPDSVTKIGATAFAGEGNSGLETIYIGSKVSSLEGVFKSTPNLKNITIAEDNPYFVAVNNVVYTKDYSSIALLSQGVTKVVLPEAITDVGTLFSRNKGIKEVVLTNVTEIKKDAFRFCDNLETVVLSDNVTAIGDYAFSGCKNLTSIDLPKGLKSIGSYAFDGCVKLKNITIPAIVETLGSYAFSSSSSSSPLQLEAITFEENSALKAINAGTFKYCTKLAEIDIPEGVETVADNAFYGCTSLTSIYLPSTLKSFSMKAFAYAYQEKTIYYAGTVEQFESMTTGIAVYYNGPVKVVIGEDTYIAKYVKVDGKDTCVLDKI